MTLTNLTSADPRHPDAKAIGVFCKRWNIVEFAVFGSFLRDDFGPQSDVDVLVTFAPDAVRSLSGFLAMREELSQLFGHRVDLLDKCDVERDVNWYRKREILHTARVIHVA